MSTTDAYRRQLRYATLQEFLKDAEALARNQSATLGEWSIGQIFEHLARVMDKSIDGFESSAPLPFRIMRPIEGRMFLKRILRSGMPAGFRLKGESAAEVVPEEIPTEQGLEHLRSAIERLETESQRHPHPAFGAMSREEWEQLHLRHAELHMSFITEV